MIKVVEEKVMDLCRLMIYFYFVVGFWRRGCVSFVVDLGGEKDLCLWLYSFWGFCLSYNLYMLVVIFDICG